MNEPTQEVVDQARIKSSDALLVRDTWSKRRLRLDLVLIVFCSLLSFIIFWDKTTAVDQLAVPSIIAGIVSLIASYVFGAAWDYKIFTDSLSNSLTKKSDE